MHVMSRLQDVVTGQDSRKSKYEMRTYVLYVLSGHSLTVFCGRDVDAVEDKSVNFHHVVSVGS